MSILKKALNIIEERGKLRDTGGGKERSMVACVAAFNALEGTNLTERQGWAFMRVLKMARSAASSQNGRYHEDDYIDSAGYTELEAEAAQKELNKTNQR